MTTRRLRNLVEKINNKTTDNLHLIYMGGNKYGIRKGHYAFNIGKRLVEGELNQLFSFLIGYYMTELADNE